MHPCLPLCSLALHLLSWPDQFCKYCEDEKTIIKQGTNSPAIVSPQAIVKRKSNDTNSACCAAKWVLKTLCVSCIKIYQKNVQKVTINQSINQVKDRLISYALLWIHVNTSHDNSVVDNVLNRTDVRPVVQEIEGLIHKTTLKAFVIYSIAANSAKRITR